MLIMCAAAITASPLLSCVLILGHGTAAKENETAAWIEFFLDKDNVKRLIGKLNEVLEVL